MLPLKTDVLQDLSLLCPGARRSFFCRMKYKSLASSKNNANMFSKDIRCKRQTNSDKKYIVIHCTGHLKTWTQSKMGLKERESYGDGYSCNLSCLVAAGRAPPNILQTHPVTPPNGQSKEVLRNLHFLSRHTIDGKFVFIDQRWFLNGLETFSDILMNIDIQNHFQSYLSTRIFTTRTVRHKHVRILSLRRYTSFSWGAQINTAINRKSRHVRISISNETKRFRVFEKRVENIQEPMD